MHKTVSIQRNIKMCVTTYFLYPAVRLVKIKMSQDINTPLAANKTRRVIKNLPLVRSGPVFTGRDR
ncbi:Uncharacterised protein [Enterobacter cancerogenus]|uniref:Uncharacterized protein n=1 Tax=Enterobacter cancerogenus TaxID=69218 RepID=A0A484ZAC2_9ENTR|nr:Uncharacterised protein [Enterobacter cancerogenus]